MDFGEVRDTKEEKISLHPQRYFHGFLPPLAPPIQCDAETILTYHWLPRLGFFEGCSMSWYLSRSFLSPRFYPISVRGLCIKLG